MSREILEASRQFAAGASGSGSTRRLLTQSEFYMTGVLPVSPEVLAADVPVSCTICVGPLEEGVVRLQLCGHLFHTACITRWFDCNSPRNGRRRGTCPNCRCELYVPDPPRGSLPVVAGGMDDSDGGLGEEDDEDSDWSEESVDRSPGPPHELPSTTTTGGHGAGGGPHPQSTTRQTPGAIPRRPNPIVQQESTTIPDTHRLITQQRQQLVRRIDAIRRSYAHPDQDLRVLHRISQRPPSPGSAATWRRNRWLEMELDDDEYVAWLVERLQTVRARAS